MGYRTVKLGKQGRLVVPGELRDEMGLEAGDELLATLEGDRLVLERRASVIERLRQRFRDLPGSMADELIAERRAEAAREQLE